VTQTLVETAVLTLPPSVNFETVVWKDGLPSIKRTDVTLRELRLSDAPALFEMLSTEEVSRFVSPPPTSVAGFERFIGWAHKARSAGRFVCFGIIPDGHDHVIGLIQVRPLGPTFDVAEWGFAIGSAFWGRDIFTAAAREVLAFTFTALGSHRLEARASADNGRGNGALRKVGATREGVLRESFLRDGIYHDQVLWSICADDWRQRQLDTTTSH
jgi:[ribosomal protein S5]-alanine N-acetyltransferase